MSSIYSIYIITNNITKKQYVGYTKRIIKDRLKSHIYEANSGKYNMYLHNSIRKYGGNHFSISLIESCTEDNVYDREIYWIEKMNTIQPHGYNEHFGGKGGCLNASAELRKKLSDARKNYFKTHTIWNKGREFKQYQNCILCEKSFKPRGNKLIRKYCSMKCSSVARRKKLFIEHSTTSKTADSLLSS